MKTVQVGGNLKLVCVLVGLPARGKSYISQKLSRYLLWLGLVSKVFNVGNYRRDKWGSNQTHEFFDPKNQEGQKQRLQSAHDALVDMFNWFKTQNGEVAIYDATNSTIERRKFILEHCQKEDVQVLFVESICTINDIITQNIKDVKTGSPDYFNQKDPSYAIEDFQMRIKHYESAYETIDDKNLTYMKIINVGSKVIINKIRGYLESRVVYYLMNLHIRPRSIFFSRHGESIYNQEGKIGGDSMLSERGKLYAAKLPFLIKENLGTKKLKVWTSTLNRTIQTAQRLPYPKKQWKELDELDAGVCDGMTYEQIENEYPEDFRNRDEDKYNYRYRGGESYKDIVLRLESVIMELERQENILIISHQAVLRCIYAYFMNYSQDDIPYLKIPLHTLIKLQPLAYQTLEERFSANIEAVETHRPKPSNNSSNK